MKADSLDAVAQRQYVQHASAQSRRLARLIDDLFEMTQLDDRRVLLKASRVRCQT